MGSLFLAVPLLGCAPAVAPPPAAAPPEVESGDGEESDAEPIPATAPSATSLLTEVDRQLRAVRVTSYSHAVRIDEASGTFVYDCSGFVGYAVGNVNGAALREVRDGGKRPLAKHFEAFFAAIPAHASHWSRVERAIDLAPGDVVAWIRPPDSTSKNTGHVLVVHGAPSRRAAGEILVPIADSTAVPHGSTDSRAAAHASGLGTGSIVLVVDDAGRPTGFRWTPASRRIYTTPIAMGRLK